ncbi:MAG: hypothetical protein R3293_14700 [Candidatus Promineifilaceae bacterium]|nr:hypothetical protein [Candidatus Promineifilaceae bacterium]
MDRPIGVDCRFEQNGQVQVRRMAVGDSWLVVEPGRQWIDEDGRHVLIMVPGGRVFEIVLSPETLTWKLVSSRTKTNIL